MLSLEKILLASAWVVTIIVIILAVPKNKIREAWVIFLFKQILTWLLGLVIVELRLIEYPVRLFFQFANKASFSFEYLIYPAVCVVFNLHFPKSRKRIIHFLYYALYCTGITIIEVLCERYTSIINYTGWTWYYTWISLYITFYITRKFYLWFFKLGSDSKVNELPKFKKDL